MYLWLYFFWAIVALFSAKDTSGADLHYTGQKLSNFVIFGDAIFVSGTNLLSRLNGSSLEEVERISTGPKLDSPSCHASGCSENKTRLLTDNINKVLVLDPENESLLLCGSLFQGACTKYPDLSDLSKSEFLPQPVAANDASSSTFAFIGPQRYNRWGHGNVLYVGTTFTHSGDYRHDVPAIASRNLHDLRFAEYSFSKQSLLRIDVKYRDQFLVRYVYGFFTSSHIYFIIVQKKSHIAGNEDHGHISRLARVCISDPNFDTYAEVTLDCDEGTASAAYYAQQSLYVAFSGRKRSKVCQYKLEDIEKKFNENIHNCFNGSTKNRNLDYISGPILEGKCPSTENRGNIRNFCEVGIKISGQLPIIPTKTLLIDGQVTALTASNYTKQNVLFIGTQEGKVILAVNFSAKIINAVPTAVLKLEAVKEDLLVLEKSTLHRIPISHCSDYSSCEECLVDTYCDWCSTGHTCSTVGSCPASSRRCVRIIKTRPTSISHNSSSDIFVYVSGLERRTNQTIACSYSIDVGEYETQGQLFDDGILCPMTRLDVTDQKEVKLSLQLSGSKYPIGAVSIPVINCRSFRTCKTCLASDHCQWCHGARQCQGKEADFCPYGNACPVISHAKQMEIANNVPSQLEMEFQFLPRELETARLFCMVTLEDAKMKIPAHVKDGSKVICERRRYSFEAEAPKIQAHVTLATEDGFGIDGTNFTLFKCSYLGKYRNIDDCSLCVSFHAELGCVWCGSNVCSHKKECRLGIATTKQCPMPEIYFVSPTSGPLEGGTLISLDGINLPSEVLTDVKVSVGNRECKRTTGNTEITCKTPATTKLGNTTISIEGPHGRSTASVGFRYSDYSILGGSPKKGPISGRVLLKIRGQNLDIGQNITIMLDDLPCRMHNLSKTREQVLCYLDPVSEPRVTKTLQVEIDSATRSIPFRFEFTPDPLVLTIKPLQSFSSGGRVLSIHGKYFSSLQPVELVASTKAAVNPKQECQIISDRLIECVSPKIDTEKSFVSNLGLRTTQIDKLLDLNRAFPRLDAKLQYHPDPVYFANGYTVYDKELLVIEGQGLSLANDVDDVSVEIGDSPCNVTSITLSQLLCVPPQAGLTGNDLTVRVSSTLEYDLGPVSFQSESENEFSSEIVGAIGATAVLMIFITIVVLIVLKHKSTEVEREYKRIQIQMDILEHNVRSECKQAFAELQTDMTDLAMDLESAGIPIYPRKTFLMNMFFPGVKEHPVILPQFGIWPSEESALLQLNQIENLLTEKQSLISLIEAFDRRTDIGAREKINFASLLSVVLCEKMDYFADILQCLIANSVLVTRHPELLFKRTETVIEKLLSNWLSICLYDYIKDEVGPSLFLLYKAVKCQIEKGPVDKMTQESKYSLVEGSLLQQNHDYSTVNCLVLQRELDEAYETKVLDTDSVSQVKAKILDAVYKNTPFSLRPVVEEVDLEWQCGQDAHVVLQDIDLTTETQQFGNEAYKRVNTLKHYGIKHKALVSLVPKQFHKSTYPFEVKDNCAVHLQPPPRPMSISKVAGQQKTKNIPEVYLTRLLATKGTLKKYINDFFTVITKIEGRFPCSIKWLFDLFDSICDTTTSQRLKTNCLYHNFWATLLKNPDIIYDIERTETVSSNLQIIAQVIAASSEMTISKETPSHFLLFTKEMSEFQQKQSQYHLGVRHLPTLSRNEFVSHMNQLSVKQSGILNSNAALKELSLYIQNNLSQS